MLEQIGDEIWVCDQLLKLLGFLEIGHRMTVLRVDGELVLHSPVGFTAALKAEIDDLGAVSHIVAPSKFHDLYLRDWSAAFPDSVLLAPAEFPTKSADVDAGLPLSWPSTLAREIDLVSIAGMPAVNETLLLHRSSGSLIVADFVFNLRRECSVAAAVVWKLNGVYLQTAASRFYRSCVKDRQALRLSVDEVLALDFDRIVVGHGDLIDTGGKQAIAAAYDWLQTT